MYYYGFQKKFPSGGTPWTSGDDQLVSLLFSKIVAHTANAGAPFAAPASTEAMERNLFDLLLYINKDCLSC